MHNTSKKILILGSRGMLGKKMVERLNNHLVISPPRDELNLENYEACLKYFTNAAPDLIINCAAYTDVEMSEKMPYLAFDGNFKIPSNIARACSIINIPLIHFSTDYVYGKNSHPISENSIRDPLNVYGYSKLLGEQVIQQTLDKYLIFRVSWLYDLVGKNFYTFVLNKLKNQESLSIVHDQVGVPTSCELVASSMIRVIEKISNTNFVSWGDYQLCPNGSCSWLEFAREIAIKRGFNLYNISNISSKELKLNAKRPKYSVLENKLFQKTFKFRIKDWKHYV
jgi:dTDP-4-dehydrorhamnose reductase